MPFFPGGALPRLRLRLRLRRVVQLELRRSEGALALAHVPAIMVTRLNHRALTMTINWAYFPRNEKTPEYCTRVVDCFKAIALEVDSHANNEKIGEDYKDGASNFVLAKLRPGLVDLGFTVEASKMAVDKISIPVLFGQNGKPTKSFEADAYHREFKFVVEVEAGRAVTNYQFLKDLFQASVMVDVDYLCIAVRNVYRKSSDFDKVYTFMDTSTRAGESGFRLKVS